MSKPTKAQQQEREEAIARLRELFKPGDKVHLVLRHVSSSGMTRVIAPVKFDADGDARYWGRFIAIACGDRYDIKRDGIVVSGCGMDMGFSLVYNLGRVLFPDGFGLWPLNGKEMPQAGTYERATTKDHAATMVAQGFKFRGRNGDASGWDNDGGYALKSVWL